MSLKLIGLSLTLALSPGLFAEETSSESKSSAEGTSKVEASSVVPNTEKKTEITNSRLAADAGATSKWSGRFVLSYSGGSIENPLSRVRPNYRSLSNAVYTTTELGGSVSLAYRLDSVSQLRFGAGVAMATPLHNSMADFKDNRNTDGNQIFNVSDPGVSYARTIRSGNLMTLVSGGVGVFTHSFSTDRNHLGSASLSVQHIYAIEGSGFQPGLSYSLGQTFYRDDEALDPADSKGRRNPRVANSVGIFPVMEYQFNDKYALRTVLGFFNYVTMRGNPSAMIQQGDYISMGFGYTPTRKIWIYPNLQFNPDMLVVDKTNVAISTIINL